MRNSFTVDGLYQLTAHAVIVDFDLGLATCALKLRREEYAAHGYGELDYSADPIIVQPEMFLVEDDKGAQRLIDDPETMRHSEWVVSLVWLDMQSNHMMVTSSTNVELLCEVTT